MRYLTTISVGFPLGRSQPIQRRRRIRRQGRRLDVVHPRDLRIRVPQLRGRRVRAELLRDDRRRGVPELCGVTPPASSSGGIIGAIAALIAVNRAGQRDEETKPAIEQRHEEIRAAIQQVPF